MKKAELEKKIKDGIAKLRDMVDTTTLAKADFSREEAFRFDELDRDVRAWETELRQIEGRGEEREDKVYLPDFRSDGQRVDVDFGAGVIGDPAKALLRTASFPSKREFRSFDDFLREILLQPTSSRSIGTLDGGQGGFATPTYLMKEIFNVLPTLSFAWAKCWVVPIPDQAGNQVELPFWKSFDRSAGKSIAGLSSTWMAEGQAGVEQTPELGLLSVSVHKLATWMSATREAVNDSMVTNRTLALLVATATAYGMDKAILRGGAEGMMPTPLGLIESPSVVSVPRKTSGSIEYVDVVKMFSRVHPNNQNNAVWMVSPSGLEKLLLMEDTAGSVIYKGGLLMNKEVFVTEHLNQGGEFGDLAFADLSQIVIASRSQLIFESSNAVHWSTDKIAYRSILRAGLHCIFPQAIRLENQTDSVSWATVLN